MSKNPSARPEQSKQSPVNLASLRREEAIERAHVAGRGILVDNTAVSTVFLSLWTDWMNANIPKACGQSDDDFGELVSAVMDAFETGFYKFVGSASIDPVLERIESLLQEHSSRAWRVHNTLAFMVVALPDDESAGLPVRCTLVELREDMEKLAASLMDLTHEAHNG
jgi:hypothetical protein